MGMVTYTCAYKPCSKEVTYAKIGAGKFRKYCCEGCRVKNRKRTKEQVDKTIAYFIERQKRFREEERCLVCGNPVVKDRLRCFEHLRYLRQYQRERRKKARGK